MSQQDSTPEPSFQDAYLILQTNAAMLENSTEPDIDSLIDTVEASIAAYKVCQARIDAVEKALNQAFWEEGSQTPKS